MPRSWDSVLRRLNDAQLGNWTAIYGVHGLADNPKISMLADPAKVGVSCKTAADCGAADSLCVTRATGSTCGAACTDDAGCPAGSACTPVRSQDLGPIKQCLR